MGDLIKIYRKLRRMNQKTLGDRSRTSQGYISDLENGKIHSPKLGTIKKLAEVLNIPDDELVEAIKKLEAPLDVRNDFGENEDQLTPEEEQMLEQYKKFLLMQRKGNDESSASCE
jgi:transcriptional regulator with XRE-family HTH domain